MSLKEISLQAGVSISTVSRALQDHPGISQTVKDNIVKIAQSTGYLAKKQQSRYTNNCFKKLLLIAPEHILEQSDLNWVSFSMIKQLKQECFKQRISIIPAFAGKEHVDIDALEQIIQAQKFDAAMVLQDDRPELIDFLHVKDFPVVLLNGEDASMRVNTITIANRFAAMMGVSYLIKQGHRRILHLTWASRITIARRCDGYKDALQNEGLPVDKNLILYLPDYTKESAKSAMTVWLERHPDLDGVSAVFCASDLLAIGVLEALKEANIAVPQRMAVLGFDDILPLDLYTPPISSVHASFLELPNMALRMLHEHLTHYGANQQAPIERREIACTLSLRQTA